MLPSLERGFAYGADRASERSLDGSETSARWSDGLRGVMAVDAPAAVIAVRAPRLAADVRLSHGLTLGVAPILWHSSEATEHSYVSAVRDNWVGGAAPRVGYFLPLSSVAGLWLKAQLPLTYVASRVEWSSYNKGLAQSTLSSSTAHYLGLAMSLSPSLLLGSKDVALSFTPELDLPIAGSRWESQSSPLAAPKASSFSALAILVSIGLVVAL
ncbi:MAG: hypothetical protein IPG50_28520 [Myxococcales bacterium]|nr:hypothetical protein [Myxococcales bacterium]